MCKTILQQLVPRDGRGALQVARVLQRQAAQAFIVFLQQGVVQAHAQGEFSKDLRVGFGLTQRCDGRAVQQHIGVAIAVVDVPVFELCGGRQHIVGMVGGVGHEMLEHHGEHILAGKALHHLGRFGGHRHRVAVVNHHGFNQLGRVQSVANRAHVHQWRTRVGVQIGALQGHAVVQRMA